MQRHDVALTLRRRYIYVMCLPGTVSECERELKTLCPQLICPQLQSFFEVGEHIVFGHSSVCLSDRLMGTYVTVDYGQI